MTRARMRKELWFEAPHRPGQLAKVCAACGKAKVNIDAIIAYENEGKALFMLCTSDNAKATDELEKMGFMVRETDVVTVDIENVPGRLAEIAQKIGEADINLEYIYGSTGSPGHTYFVVINSKENEKVMEILQ
jgi:hypothetical protein